MRFRPAVLVLLLVEAALAVLAVLVHYGLLAEYGDVTASAWEELAWSLGQTGVIALVLVLTVGAVAFLLQRTRPVGLVVVSIPLLMLVGMAVSTPLAQREKLAVQYDAVPQCVDAELASMAGPGVDAAVQSQEAFESIEHIGWFGGGGGSGVGGCDRELLMTEEGDVLGHYREALPRAGWRIVEEGPGGMRAERDAMAFEVRGDDAGRWVVWAGPAEAAPRGGITLGDTSH